MQYSIELSTGNHAVKLCAPSREELVALYADYRKVSRGPACGLEESRANLPHPTGIDFKEVARQQQPDRGPAFPRP
jgi:hypothetical protein